MRARLFSVVGILITIAGLVDLIWNQLDLPFPEELATGANRWQLATGPLFVIGLGILICIAAEILDAITTRPMRPRAATDAQPRTPAEVENLWESWSQPED